MPEPMCKRLALVLEVGEAKDNAKDSDFAKYFMAKDDEATTHKTELKRSETQDNPKTEYSLPSSR